MKKANLEIPLTYKAANTLGQFLVAVGIPNLRLDEESVCTIAKKQTGLSDFGDSYYRQGLLHLLESAEKDANLHPLGRFMTNDIITNYLAQRLHLIETRKKEPLVFDKPLIPPLIICGLARSGTTFLHNMLALDPNHRALPQWLLMRPFPEHNGNGGKPDPRIVKMEQAIQLRKPLLPGIDAIHYFRADTVEECILVLGLTFNSLIFPTLLPVYSYMDWYLQQEDTDQKYREYRWLLQVFQSQEPEMRLTLKAPAHTGNLTALTDALPSAMIIQTHRDPVACISSACSLISTFHLAVAKEIDIQRMANLILDQYETWFRRNLAFRETHPDVIYDVFFESLVSKPIETVREIYTHYELDWDHKLEAIVEDYIQNNPKDKHGKHKYSAEDFGLSGGLIKERLKFYTDHFDR